MELEGYMLSRNKAVYLAPIPPTQLGKYKNMTEKEITYIKYGLLIEASKYATSFDDMIKKAKELFILFDVN